MRDLVSIQDTVEKVYAASPDEAMSKWFYKGHVAVVADYAEEIAEKAGADKELAVLSALFHDVARAWEVEKDPELMNESLEYAQKQMKECGYSDDDFEQVKEAIVPHSCRTGPPGTELGKILATADALAHLMTDFYFILPFYGWLKAADNFDGYRDWLLEKIDRDLNKKIFFEEYKEMAVPRYEAMKLIFSKPS